MRRCRQYVYEAAERLFKAHTVWVLAHPRLVVAVVAVVTVLFSLGLMNVEIDQQVLDLWMDGHSQAASNRKYIADYYDPAPRTLDVVLDGKGDNMLAKSRYDLLWDLDAQVRALTVDTHTFDDLCYKDGGSECVTEGALQFWASNRTNYDDSVVSDEDILVAVNSGVATDGTATTTAGALGEVSYNASGYVVRAGALRVQYKIYVEDDSRLSKNKELEKKFLNLINNYDMPGVRLYRWASRTPEDEMARSMNNNVILLVVGYVLVIVFLSLVMMKPDWVQSRVLLGLGGLGVTALGIISGYGMCALANVPFTLLQVILPFMVFGIGVNDMFIIISAYDATDRSLVPEERLKRSMHRSGLALTFTATAEVIAFLLGSITDIPVVESFCLYSAASIFFVYLYQITAFVVVLYWDACRIARSHSDILFCIVVQHPQQEQNNSSAAAAGSRRLSSFNLPFSSHAKKEDPLFDDEDTTCKRFCSGFYLPPLVSDVGRLFVVLCFLAVTVLFAWAAAGTSRNFKVYDMFPDDSYGREFAEAAKDLDLSPLTQFVPVDIHLKDVGYSVSVQTEILARSDRFVTKPHNLGPVTSWLESFLSWAADSPTYQAFVVDGTFSSEANFPDALGEFLCDPSGLRFRDDIVCAAGSVDCSLAVADMTCAPVKSRLNAHHTKLSAGTQKVEAMQDARSFWKRSTLDPSPVPYSTQYLLYELLQGLYASLWQHFGFVLAAVVFVAMMILWEPWAVILLGAIIFLIDVNLLGTATLAGMDINATTAAQVSMAAGLVIDYVGHPLHYFLMQDPALSTKDRVHDAMNEVGPVITLGAFTTLIGIVPLVFGSCVMYRNFFVMVFAIVVYGAAYGLVFLPAIISFQGQEYDTQAKKRKEVADPSRLVQIADVYVAQPLNKPEPIFYITPTANNIGNSGGNSNNAGNPGVPPGSSPLKPTKSGAESLMIRTSNLTAADRLGSGLLDTPPQDDSPDSPTRHTPFSRVPALSSKSSGFGSTRRGVGAESNGASTRQIELQPVARRL